MVEHDEDTMRAADFVVDVGPGAGIHGGEIVCAGTVDDIMTVSYTHLDVYKRQVHSKECVLLNCASCPMRKALPQE